MSFGIRAWSAALLLSALLHAAPLWLYDGWSEPPPPVAKTEPFAVIFPQAGAGMAIAPDTGAIRPASILAPTPGIAVAGVAASRVAAEERAIFAPLAKRAATVAGSATAPAPLRPSTSPATPTAPVRKAMSAAQITVAELEFAPVDLPGSLPMAQWQAPDPRTPVRPVPVVPIATNNALAPALTTSATATVAAREGGGASAIQRVNLGYRERVRRKIQEYAHYPKKVAERLRISGEVLILFTVDRRGKILSTRIVSSSGHKALDRAALAMLLRAAPMPSLPRRYSTRQLSLTLPVRIVLNE